MSIGSDVQLLCDPDLCGCHRRVAKDEQVFDNNHIHDYPQWHYVLSGSSVDEVVIATGMARSKSELKRLKKQGGLKLEEVEGMEVEGKDKSMIDFHVSVVATGQRRLYIWRSS